MNQSVKLVEDALGIADDLSDAVRRTGRVLEPNVCEHMLAMDGKTVFKPTT